MLTVIEPSQVGLCTQLRLCSCNKCHCVVNSVILVANTVIIVIVTVIIFNFEMCTGLSFHALLLSPPSSPPHSS